jgi:hypothetical protein
MRTWLALSLFLVCGGTASVDAGAGSISVVHSKLAFSNWSVSASPNLAQNPPNKKLVEDFIRALDLAAKGFSTMGEEGGSYVCSFQFANLHHDAVLSLIAGIGVKDRPSCMAIEIVDKTASGFEVYSSGGELGAGSDVASNVKDLSRDGRLEFLLDGALGVIPQRCTATWTTIYAWTDGNYTNVSDHFKGFYSERLDSLKKIIPALQPVPGSSGYQLSDKECLAAEASAIGRFLGMSSDAGIDQAIRLAKGQDRGERQFAATLLGEIGTPRARQYLQTLSKDPDYGVATYAKYSLSRSVQGPMKIVADTFVKN